uniref:Uncharacterized protein n=1 Tax=Knipowitschia caucasica TaxID=637954 RepID=A0AAV2L4R3_KNICA
MRLVVKLRFPWLQVIGMFAVWFPWLQTIDTFAVWSPWLQVIDMSADRFPWFQVIQTISAVDRDEPLSGHRFYFSLASPVVSNLNFTLRDNKAEAKLPKLPLAPAEGQELLTSPVRVLSPVFRRQLDSAAPLCDWTQSS